MYRVAVCDDNREILNEIGRMLEDTTEEISDVDLYASAQELENIYTEHGQYDIILMDILLEQENGISLARRIQDQSPDTQVIFFTGYLEQAENIFGANPAAFLVKPISQDKLDAALGKAIRKLKEGEQDCVTLTIRSKILRIRVDDIYYVESNKRILNIHFRNESLQVYEKLDNFLKKVSLVFLRSHKSYAVNMNKIKYFSSEGIELCDGRIVPVSRPKYRKAKEAFLKFCGEED